MSALEPGVAASDVGSGMVAGALAGGATCMLAAKLDMLSTLALLLGSHSAVLGAGLHLTVAAGLGVLFAACMASATRLRDLVTGGVLYGVVWWVVVPLMLMPAWVSQDTNLVVVQFAVLSMAGQAIYGPLAGLLVYAMRRRRARATR